MTSCGSLDMGKGRKNKVNWCRYGLDYHSKLHFLPPSDLKVKAWVTFRNYFPWTNMLLVKNGETLQIGGKNCETHFLWTVRAEPSFGQGKYIPSPDHMLFLAFWESIMEHGCTKYRMAPNTQTWCLDSQNRVWNELTVTYIHTYPFLLLPCTLKQVSIDIKNRP